MNLFAPTGGETLNRLGPPPACSPGPFTRAFGTRFGRSSAPDRWTNRPMDQWEEIASSKHASDSKPVRLDKQLKIWPFLLLQIMVYRFC
jgi:hypothetical protein